MATPDCDFKSGVAPEGHPYKLASWASGPEGHLSSGIQLKIVSTLNVYRSGACASTDNSTNRCAFATACDRADDGANRSTNGRARDGLFGLIAIPDRAFVINLDYVTIRRTNAFQNTGKPVASTVA